MATPRQRPLSPHLQVYKPQLTSFMSIFHRATGIFMSFGVLALVYWLLAIAAGPEAFKQAQGLLGSWVGLLLLFGWTFSLFYHLSNGIRHLFWDAGHGFELKSVYASGYFAWFVTFALTAIVWIAGFSMMKGGA